MRLSLLIVALLAATGGSVGHSLQTQPEPHSDWIGQFGNESLEVAGTRFASPMSSTSAAGSPSDWEALWDRYIESLYDDCVTTSTPGLERCDVVLATGPGAQPEEAGVPAITINDLAQFRPLVGELVVEPDGWGVVGTPTNFYATAETHTMDGELFDAPIEVRWTPTSYVFDYGDGSVETSEASGTAWRGTEESWTETATSHIYAARDDVTASLTVVFTAEVDAGTGWFAVPGTLPVDAPSVTVKVFEVDTVLTDGDCMADPRAAGCG